MKVDFDREINNGFKEIKIVFNESVVEKIKELEEEFELIREELNEIVFENEIFRSKM